MHFTLCGLPIGPICDWHQITPSVFSADRFGQFVFDEVAFNPSVAEFAGRRRSFRPSFS